MLEGGYHLVLDLEGGLSGPLDSKEAMIKLCRDIARILDTKVLQVAGHKFKPQGVTAFALIAESHVSVHTWPESGKAFLDIFSCKKTLDVHRILDFVRGVLGAKRGRATLFLRNSRVGRRLFSTELPIVTMDLDFGKTIYAARSPFQRIELTKGPMGLSLFLNGYWQFVEKYEHIYHEALIHPAMVCAPRLRRVGIGGGGDGLALREILRYPELGRVWMYELDPKMLAVARHHPEMIRLNRRALDHPKATVVAADARKMLTPKAHFDVLIFDFPSISDGTTFKPLYSVPMYQRAKRALAPEGVLITQVTDFPWHLRRAIRNLKQVFPHVHPIQIGVGDSIFNFVGASTQPFRQRRALPPGLRFLRRENIEAYLGKQGRRKRSAMATMAG